MKLYYNPGACSMAPHIALREAGLAFTIEHVDLAAQRTESGADFRAIAPKGSVPVLRLGDGQILTEGAAILQYIADQAPAARLAPAAGSFERYRLQEWLNYLSSEIHRGFTPLFSDEITERWRQVSLDLLSRRLDFLSRSLSGRAFLVAEDFGVADCYLFTLLTWPGYVGFDLEPWPELKNYRDRIAARESVRAAMAAEGVAIP